MLPCTQLSMTRVFAAIMFAFLGAQTLWAQRPSTLPPPAAIQVDFTRDVKPILHGQCYACHGSSQQKSNLRLDHRQAALRGGDSGPVILPGNSAASKLIIRLVGSELGIQMPPTGPLTAEEIGILRAWIDQGADWPDVSLEEVAPTKEQANLDPRSEDLFQALRKGDTGAVQALMRRDHSLVNLRDGNGATPLMHAALYASADCMRWLLDQGADVNARNSAGATALMWAAGELRKVRLLLARGADVNSRSGDGKTPLLIAAGQDGAAPIVELLLENGADIRARDTDGATPLMHASGAGDLETMRLLIARGRDVNARSNNGGTALMAAARSRNFRAIQLLLAQGAEVNASTKRGITALELVANSGITGIIRALLEKGADVDAKDDRGYTPLMLAAYSDFLTVDTVKLLLDRGADVTARSNDGETALSLAEKKGDTEIVRLLKKSNHKRIE